MALNPRQPTFFRQRQEQERVAPLHVSQVVAVTNVKNVATTLYTVPDGKLFFLQQMAVCNLGSGNLAVTVNVVADGGSAAATNRVYNGLIVATATTVKLTELEGSMLEPGDFIVVVTDDATDGGNFWLWGEAIEGGDPSR